MEKQYKPLLVANTFIGDYGGPQFTHMKIQKLVYLAYCWWLAKKEEPFIDEQPQVWQYGPVFNSLYTALRGYGSSLIQAPHQHIFDEPALFVDKEDEIVMSLIRWVWEKYGSLDAKQLSSLTHEDGSPWHTMASRYDFKVPSNLPIDIDVIKEHYRNQLKDILPDDQK